MKNTLQHIIQLSIILLSFSMSAQIQTPVDIAFRTMETDFKKYNLLKEDIEDVVVNDNVYTSSNEMSNIYFVQRYKGIEIYNAIMNFTIAKDGRVVYLGNRFFSGISFKMNTTKPLIGPDDAIMSCLINLGGSLIVKPRLKETKSDKSFVFDKGNISNSDIAVKLRFQPMNDGSLRLAWDVALDYKAGTDYWSMRIDAVTGQLLDKKSFTVHCNISKDNYSHLDECGNPEVYFPEMLTAQQAKEKATTLLLANQYNVFPYPFESPSQGGRKLLTNPADVIASPFGWHDNNGVAGNEYTITRGNNVYAYQDRDADYNSANDEPNGTANLVFDFPIDLTKEPDQYTKAAVVQLFYAVNYMHDFSYHFGFDEYANFQDYNKPGSGIGNDHIVALSQFDANTLININNADFTSPPDGEKGRMRMFLWDNSLSLDKNLIVNAPFNVAGAYTSSVSDFGAELSYTSPVTGFAIVANDGDKDNPTFACNPLEQGNGTDLKGKIAIIDRGGCDYDYKVLNAQNNGAIAVIVCNFAESSSPMGGNLVADQVKIPSVQIKKSDCDKIRIAAGAGGLNITLQGPPPNSSGPLLRDGSLDNAIIAHEFTHGISNRLTGGPSSAGCLTSGEQMGEGWS
ncbi:MAG TPA: M36 family metallopeptidase, partial [Saprospiraceae bacterium]|nr:M36 family metallopeptidase [Saprospiraceae bacterium]